MVGNNIKVSIVLLAYNHGEFIREALESILMQKVNFRYEVIIGEDCSPDNTREIIFEYQKKYSDIIKPIIRKHNVGGPANFYEALLKCGGEYIATLEGDDFWTDYLKLQKQVDFLTNNQQYMAVAHRHIIVDRFGTKIGCSNERIPLNTRIGKKELLKFTTALAHPGTMCYRNIFINSSEDFTIIRDSNKYGSHFMMLSLLMSKGTIYIMDNYMSAWRCIIESNATNYTSMANRDPLEVAENYFNMIRNFQRYFGEQYNYSRILARHFAVTLFVILKQPSELMLGYIKRYVSYLNGKEICMSLFYFFIMGVQILLKKVKFSIFHR